MPMLLALLILVPIVGAVLALLARGRSVQVLALVFSAGAAGLGLYLVAWHWGSLANAAGALPSATAPEGDLVGVVFDPLSALMLIVAVGIGFLVVLFSVDYVGPRNVEHPYQDGSRRYYFWLLLFIGSMVGVALSPNLLQLFIFWELTTLCSWALIRHSGTSKSVAAGRKALVMTSIGGLFFVAALALLFFSTKSFGFSALASAALSEKMRSLLFFRLLVAVWAKVAQIPFHTWLADTAEAPAPVSAYLDAAAMATAGAYLMARIVLAGHLHLPGMGVLMLVTSLLTMFVALLFYFVQDDLKRLLAYSTIAHLGYVLFGISLGMLGSEQGYQGGVLHMVTHGFAKGTLFLAVGAIAYAAGTRSLRELSGLGRAMPLVGLSFFVGAFAVTGVPPLSCFWSKFLILVGTVGLHSWVGPVLLVLVLAESVISFGWFLYVGQKVFWGQPSPATNHAKQRISGMMAAALVILMAMCVLAPWIGMPLIRMLVP